MTRPERAGEFIHFTYEDDDGNEIEEKLPARYEVCSRCHGRGTHSNPSIDENGITAEEWERDWSFEERQDYINGVYDVTCEECKGLRVVLVVDRDTADPKLLEIYDNAEAFRASYAYEKAYERKWGY